MGRREPRGAARALPGIPRHRLLLDRGARWFITGGGIGVIGVVLGIMLFLLAEAWPLLGSARLGEPVKLGAPGDGVAALAVDAYRTFAAALGEDGVLRVTRLADGSVVLEQPLAALARSPQTGRLEDGAVLIDRALGNGGAPSFGATTRDGRLIAVPVEWDVRFEGDTRIVTPSLGETVELVLDPASRRVGAAAWLGDDEQGTAVAQLAGGELAVARRVVEVNPFSGERREELRRSTLKSDHRLAHLVLDPTQRFLYGAAAGGELLWWDLRDGGGPRQVVAEAPAPVTALTLLAGGRSLVVGRADGSLSVWFRVRYSEIADRLTRIRSFPPFEAPVARLAPAHRNRTFLAVDSGGSLGLFYSTSTRVLAREPAPLPRVDAAAIAPKGDAMVLAGSGRLAEIPVDSPHPEAGLSVYFGKVWYEGFQEPTYTWQSTGGTDEFESKLSLVPLVFGTIKGAFYSLLLAVPLGILGAIYASQFMHPKILRVVKPTVEVMASLPSVVLGFVGGLWLAPRMEANFTAFLLMTLLLPVTALAAGGTWALLPRHVRGRVPDGGEIVWYIALGAAGIWVSFLLGPPLEAALFAGDFQDWLYETTGLRYDQRNALVVGIAMGFAVIPIVFSIAEDAFSNVPRDLIAGSLALGASRWETVVRVVLPTASPGVFSAVMVGLGRAVGETMIVLMATGNTPILDWNVFNGFRTLAANIAVEIPEAPQGGTLYRTLFLTAVLLFAMTFVINTAAELVRARLRARYSRL